VHALLRDEATMRLLQVRHAKGALNPLQKSLN
jgi:hypothetical protein